MTAEAELELELAEDDVEDLADIAAAHPVVHKRLDLSKINVLETLSLGDVEDMARELGTDPSRLQSVLARGGDHIAINVAIVLAWILGRKADPDLDIGEVRRFWQIELVGVGKSKPDPTPARTKTRRSSVQRGSSRTRG